MFTLTKQFAFEAAHQLFGLADGHPCGRLHGHSYRVEIELRGDTLNAHGFVRDYRELDAFKKYVDESLDHRNLNGVLPCATTAENLAQFLYGIAKGIALEVSAVRVSETQKTWAEYRP